MFTHWECDPCFIGELHGLGSLQLLSSQEKICLLYSAGIFSALVGQSSAESPLVPYHLLWWKTLLWKAVFLEGFCRCCGQCAERRPAAASGRGWLPVASQAHCGSSSTRFTESIPELAWGRRQPAAVLHSCAGALSHPSGLLCLRKEGRPALLPST